jgi:hypothetical protein
MLEGFKDIVDENMLFVVKSRMLRIRQKLVHRILIKGKTLTEKEEKELKLYLFADEGPGRTFVNDDHCLQLIEQWLKEAEIHGKSLKEKEKPS